MISKGWSCVSRRGFALSCPPRHPPGTCACPAPYVPRTPGRPIPPADCLPPGPIPYNPCRPIFHTGHSSKKFKYIFYLFLLPLIIIRTITTLGHDPPHKAEVCRAYEYMRIRSKRFPWGDGTKSLFHNDHTNNLPSECAPPPRDECDFDTF